MRGSFLHITNMAFTSAEKAGEPSFPCILLQECFRGPSMVAWAQLEAAGMFPGEKIGYAESPGIVDSAQLNRDRLSHRREAETHCTPPKSALRTTRKCTPGPTARATSRKLVATSKKRKRENPDEEKEEEEGGENETKTARRRIAATGHKSGAVHTDKKPRVEPSKRKSRAQKQSSEQSSEDEEEERKIAPRRSVRKLDLVKPEEEWEDVDVPRRTTRKSCMPKSEEEKENVPTPDEEKENMLRRTTRKSYMMKPEPLIEMPMTARTRRRTVKQESVADGLATVQRNKRAAPTTAGKARTGSGTQTTAQEDETEAPPVTVPGNEQPIIAKVRARAVRGRNAGRQQAQAAATGDGEGALGDTRRRSVRQAAVRATAELTRHAVEAEQTLIELGARRRRTAVRNRNEGEVKVEPEVPVSGRAQAGRKSAAARRTVQPTPHTDDGQAGARDSAHSQEHVQEPQTHTSEQPEGLEPAVTGQSGAGSMPTVTTRRLKRTKTEPKQSPPLPPPPPSQATETSAASPSPETPTETEQTTSPEPPAISPPPQPKIPPPPQPKLSPPVAATADTSPIAEMETEGASNRVGSVSSVAHQPPSPTPVAIVAPPPPAPFPPANSQPRCTVDIEPRHPAPTSASPSTASDNSHPVQHSASEQPHPTFSQLSEIQGDGDMHVTTAAAAQEKGPHANRFVLKRRTGSIVKVGKKSTGAYGWNGRSPGKRTSAGGEQRRSHSTVAINNTTHTSGTFESNHHTGRSIGGNTGTTEHVVDDVEKEREGEEEVPPPIQEESETERDAPLVCAPAPAEPTPTLAPDASDMPRNSHDSPHPTPVDSSDAPLPILESRQPTPENAVIDPLAAPLLSSPSRTVNTPADDSTREASEAPVCPAGPVQDEIERAPPSTVEGTEEDCVPADTQPASPHQESTPQTQHISPSTNDTPPVPTPGPTPIHETRPVEEVATNADLPNMAGSPADNSSILHSSKADLPNMAGARVDDSSILQTDPPAPTHNSTMPMAPSPPTHHPPPAEDCTMVPETPQEKSSPPPAVDFAKPNIATDVRFVSTRARRLSDMGDMTPPGFSQILGSTPFVPHVATTQARDMQPIHPGKLLIDQSPIVPAPPRVASVGTVQIRPPGSLAKAVKPATPKSVKAPQFGRLQINKSGTKAAGTPGRPSFSRPGSAQKVAGSTRDPRSPPPTLKRNHDTIAEEGSDANMAQSTAKRARTEPEGADGMHGLDGNMAIMPATQSKVGMGLQDQSAVSVAGRGMTAGPAGFGASTLQTYMDNTTMGRGRTLLGSTMGARGMDPSRRVRTYEERKKIQEENLRRVEEEKKRKMQDKRLKELADREKQVAEQARQQRLRAEEAKRKEVEAQDKRRRLAEEKAREEEAKREALRQAEEAQSRRQEEMARQEQERKRSEAEDRRKEAEARRLQDLEMQVKKQQEALEAERRERERERKERVEKERVERLRVEKQREEEARRETERRKEEEERRKREEEEKKRNEREKEERERVERERAEQERKKREREERERAEQERRKQERAERERQELEAELEKMRREVARMKEERERMAREKEENERMLEEERKERERERLERERAEREREEKERQLEEERKERERERVERERVEREKAEKERMLEEERQERMERERLLQEEKLAREREREEKERLVEEERVRQRALREKEQALEQERLAREEEERGRVRREQAERERERLAQEREEREAERQRAAEQAKRVAALQEEKEKEREMREKIREAGEKTFSRPPATPAMVRGQASDRAFRSIMNSPYVNSTPRTRSKKKAGVPHSHRKTPAEELVELEALDLRAQSRAMSTPMAAPLGSRLPSDTFKAPAPVVKAKAEPVAESLMEDEESDGSLRDYGIDDLSSGSDTDYDDDPKKPIPGWATGHRFKEAIYSQDPSTPPIFKDFRNHPVENMCLEDILKKKLRPALKRRGSSVGWNESP